MLVRVRYQDGSYDVIHPELFDYKLSEGNISAFYRNSEQRWIIPGVDLLRSKQMPKTPRRRYGDA